jgi:hypothetical protein
MPFIYRSNSKPTPPNSRAVDVAREAIRDLIPVQQRKYDNAFKVQGYESLVYNRLTQGVICSCQGNQKVFSTLLDSEGKLSVGTMNGLLTGGMEFKIQPYGARASGRADLREPRKIKPLARDDQFYGELIDENVIFGDNVGRETDPYITRTPLGTPGEHGDNGPIQTEDLDDEVEMFDTNILDMSSSKCTVCFGTGFVGGYSVLHSWRRVFTCHSQERTEVIGTIEANQSPNKFFAQSVTFSTILPRGFIYLDAFKIWNNNVRAYPDHMLIDGLPYSDQLLTALCDGRVHLIQINFEVLTYWSHLEIQIGLSREAAMLEFPKLTSGTNIEVRDLTEDVQIIASPTIPKLSTYDVLVESSFGKTFIVGNSSWWNDKDRNVLGWEVTARVIQPSELLHLLPRRRQLQQRSSAPIRDNAKLARRT